MNVLNRSLRYIRRLSLSSPLRNRYRWTLSVLVLFCFTLIAITKLAKSDTTITIAHFDTKIYNERILDSEDLIVSNSQGMLESDAPRSRKSSQVRFSYTQSEGYNNSIVDCESIKRIKVKYVIASGFNSLMYGAKADLSVGSTWLSIRIVSKKSPDVLACLSQSNSNELKIDCNKISDEILSHEASLLNRLRHANIAPVLNLCRRVDTTPNVLSRVGTKIMILEDAKPLDMNEMLNLSWKDRVKICVDIASIVERLSTNISLQLVPFELRQFYQSSKHDVIKLVDTGGLISSEPSCSSNEDCYITSTVVTDCRNNSCKEFSWKANSISAHRVFYSVLLSKQPPPILLPHVMSLLEGMQKSRFKPPSITTKLLKLHNISNYIDTYGVFRITGDLDLDLNTNSALSDKKKKRAEYVYDEIPDAEISDTHNYHCASTIKPDRCVFPVDSPSQAQDLCSSDDECQSVSIAPNPASQAGWFLASLKRSASNLLYRPGSRLFLKRVLERPQQLMMNHDTDTRYKAENKIQESKKEEKKELEQREIIGEMVGKPIASSSLEAMHNDECYSSIYSQYKELFARKEDKLMKICGWNSVTDSQWIESMQTLSLRSEGLMKSSKSSLGGGIKLNLGSDPNKKAWMKIKPDMTSQQRHVSQLAFFLLDRLLGLFVTVPTTGRRLLVNEITDSDITIALSKMQISPDEDSSFKCTLSAWATSVQGIAGQRWTLTPQREITWAISRFSYSQKNQLAFLLANWLGLMPFKPQNAVQVQQGYNIHIDNDAAFTVVPNDIFLYFNNCQFPKQVIEILVKLKERPECTIASILYRALNADPLNIAFSNSKQNNFSLKIVDQMARILLQTADQCIKRFGHDNVLYEDDW